MNYEYPQSFARFYDLIYHQVRDGVDNDFFLNEVKKTKGKVLEIGVGTGRFFNDALNSCADVYGIDISDSMLNVLKSKLDNKQHFRISNQSIVDFKFDTSFDLIIAPFRVISHVLDKKDHLTALNNVFKHLKPGGKFIFDVFVPNPEQLTNGLENLVDFEGEFEPGQKIKRIVSTKPDIINQIINIHFRFEWDETGTTKTDDWKIPFRIFFRYELEHLIERSNFQQFEILGDYNGNLLNEKSKEFVCICYKK
jgi:ubiquinone/menaquinone biosynthesis C-methylase UbiE